MTQENDLDEFCDRIEEIYSKDVLTQLEYDEYCEMTKGGIGLANVCTKEFVIGGIQCCAYVHWGGIGSDGLNPDQMNTVVFIVEENKTK